MYRVWWCGADRVGQLGTATLLCGPVEERTNAPRNGRNNQTLGKLKQEFLAPLRTFFGLNPFEPFALLLCSNPLLTFF